MAKGPITISAGAGAMSGSLNVAVAKGFLKDEGVNGKVISYKKGKIAFDKYLAGEDDFATCNIVAIVLTDFDFTKHRLISTLSYTDSGTILLARKSSGITKVSDLKGKRIGIVRATSAHFYLCKYLVIKGISCDDVEIVYLTKKQLPEAIASGQVDAICQHGMPIEKAKKALKDDWVEFYDDSIYRISIQLLGSKKMIDARPKMIRGMLKAALKADAFIKSHEDEAIKILAKDKGYPVEIMDGIIKKEADFNLSLKQSLLIQLETVEKWAIENKLVNRTTPRNYMEFIEYQPLEDVAPEKVTLIR